jgi:xanthine dehydrogenase accessory factor
MRDLLPELKEWINANEAFALATVVSTWGSAPRSAGSYMAIRHDGAVLGSVSGGCVEGAVISAATEIIAQQSSELLHFGVADETAWDVGLACGGKIDVFLQSGRNEALITLIEALEEDNQAVHVFDIANGSQAIVGVNGRLFSEKHFPQMAWEKASTQLDRATSSAQIIEISSNQRLFYNPLTPTPEIVIIGGGQITQALVEMAITMHFVPIVIDPRRNFISENRFPDQTDLIHAFPKSAFEEHPLQGNSAVASLSHDPKIDDPALAIALSSDAFYVGALGSRKTHQKRIKRLEQAGVSQADLARIQSPIGIEIGATNPEEIALAVISQIVQLYRA